MPPEPHPHRVNVTFRKLLEKRLGNFPHRPAGKAVSLTAAVAVAIVEQGYGADLPGFTRPESWQDHAMTDCTLSDTPAMPQQ